MDIYDRYNEITNIDIYAILNFLRENSKVLTKLYIPRIISIEFKYPEYNPNYDITPSSSHKNLCLFDKNLFYLYNLKN